VESDLDVTAAEKYDALSITSDGAPLRSPVDPARLVGRGTIDTDLYIRIFLVRDKDNKTTGEILLVVLNKYFHG
jgi:hypothetical protein